nr:hypothetical protein BgiMline_014751 [Biomphalaria glabrata]
MFCGALIVSISFDVGLSSTATSIPPPASQSSNQPLSPASHYSKQPPPPAVHSTRLPVSTKAVHHTIRYRTGLLNHLENTWAFTYNTPASYSLSTPPEFSTELGPESPSSWPTDLASLASSSFRASGKAKVTSKRGAYGPPKTIYLVVLLPENETFMYSMRRVYPAITIATDIVVSTKLLNGYKLETLYADSKCHIGAPMNEAIKVYMQSDKIDLALLISKLKILNLPPFPNHGWICPGPPEFV